MNKFIPSDYRDKAFGTVALALLFSAVMIVCAFVRPIPEVSIFCCALTVIATALAVFIAVKGLKSGLYTENDRIYFKGVFAVRDVDLQEIAAVVILKAATETRYSIIDIKDKNKNCCYRMIFLKDFSVKMQRFLNVRDITFIKHFGKNVYFSTVYDEELLEAVKNANLDLKILDGRCK